MKKEKIEQLAQQVADSLKSAASEILGRNLEKFNDYFKVHEAMFEGRHCIAVVEQVTGDDNTIVVPLDSLERNSSDRFYYSKLKELPELILPHLPEDELDIPLDVWPEPAEWKPEKDNKDIA